MFMKGLTLNRWKRKLIESRDIQRTRLRGLARDAQLKRGSDEDWIKEFEILDSLLTKIDRAKRGL